MSEYKKISIITATYNRSKYLERLYNSICEQNYSHLEWIVVDDGSSDNTQEIIKSLNNEKKIYIKYIQKENGGKHTAINIGIDEANSELTIIVDSDDILAKNSLNKINYLWKKSEYDRQLVGLGGLKAYFNESVVGDKIPTNSHIDLSMVEITYNYNVVGDKSIIFKTDILKQNKFPEIKNERFLTEAVIYNRITNKNSKIRWVNEIFILVEYLEDGLTKKYDEIMSVNWNGTSLYFEELMDLDIDDSVKKELLTEYLKYAYMNKEFYSILRRYKNIEYKYKFLGLKKGLILACKVKIKRLLRR